MNHRGRHAYLSFLIIHQEKADVSFLFRLDSARYLHSGGYWRAPAAAFHGQQRPTRRCATVVTMRRRLISGRPPLGPGFLGGTSVALGSSVSGKMWRGRRARILIPCHFVSVSRERQWNHFILDNHFRTGVRCCDTEWPQIPVARWTIRGTRLQAALRLAFKTCASGRVPNSPLRSVRL